jgi:hypothetical protein
MIKGIIKQIPKRPRLRPVCEFTTANHRDGATNDRISSSIANHLRPQLFDVALLPLNSDDIFSIPTSTGVVNVTLLNHVLYPGVVTRDAVLINNSITHIYIGNNPTNRILIPRPKESIKITESNILDIKKFAISSIYLIIIKTPFFTNLTIL